MNKTITLLKYIELQLIKGKRQTIFLNEYFDFDFIDFYFKYNSILEYNKLIYHKTDRFLIIKYSN